MEQRPLILSAHGCIPITNYLFLMVSEHSPLGRSGYSPSVQVVQKPRHAPIADGLLRIPTKLQINGTAAIRFALSSEIHFLGIIDEFCLVDRTKFFLDFFRDVKAHCNTV
jgi:hypothetical protein